MKKQFIKNEALLKAIIDGHIILENTNYVTKELPKMP